MTDAVRSPQQIRDELQARRDTIVNEMGSSERIDAPARPRASDGPRAARPALRRGLLPRDRHVRRLRGAQRPRPHAGRREDRGLGGDQRPTRFGVRRRRDRAARLLVGGRRQADEADLRAGPDAGRALCLLRRDGRRAAAGRAGFGGFQQDRAGARVGAAAAAGSRWRRRSSASRSAAPRFMPRFRTSSCRWRGPRWPSPARG